RIGTLVCTDPRPTSSWFDGPTLQVLQEDVCDAERHQRRLTELRTKLLAEFDSKLFELPIHSWRSDYHTTYRGPTRFLRPGDHRPQRQVRQVRKTLGKLRFSDAAKRIDEAATVVTCLQWFAERRDDHGRHLGFHFRGGDTRWSEITAHLKT